MANPPFEIPNELRDFAERSVEQARKAFEGFLTVAQRTAGAAGETVSPPSGAKSMSAHILAYTEQNVNAAFETRPQVGQGERPAGSSGAAKRIHEVPARSATTAGQGTRRRLSEKA